MNVALIIALALIVIVLISVAKVYRSIPIIELKRRARAGHEPAKSLYKVASYQTSSQFLLILLATIFSALFFVLVSIKSPVWVAITSCLVLIWLAYIWIPRSPINIISEYLAQKIAIPLAWILQYLHPLFKKSNKKPQHTGLYERSDIVALLTKQQKQEDNRIEDFEIDLLKHVLNFSEYKVLDLMTPKRKVHSIPEDETLGPVVLSELHRSGHTYFPIFKSKTDNIIGILGIKGLSVSKNPVNAGEVMDSNIYYVHEEQYLGEALQLVIKTSQELLIVINSHQQYVGIITAREILKLLVGESISDEFDSYDKREIVAKRFNLKETVTEEKQSNITEDSTEVIE